MNSQKYSLVLELTESGTEAYEGARVGKLLTGQTIATTIKGKRRLDCGSGAIWVTQENDPRDYILEQGMGIDIARPGKVVISALSGGSYILA
jgi:hypothetical protein